MAPFTRIYFDTNILIAANWPHLSAGLENLLGLAQLLKVGVFLPKAVEDELEAHWSRLFDEKYAKAKNSQGHSQGQVLQSHMAPMVLVWQFIRTTRK